MTNKKKTTHIIQQHTLDIQLDSEEGALDFQEWLATTARQKLPVILERVLDQHAIEGAIIQLDKLTIDLGNIQRSHFQQEFLPKLEQALHRLLTQKINELRLPFKTATVSGSIISQQQQRIQLLETYLTNGNLPWSQTENTPFPLDQVILELLQHQPKRLKAFLEKKHIRQRLQYQLSPQTIQKIVHQFPEDQALLHASSKAMESQPFTHSKTSEIGNLEVNIETPLQIIQQYLKTGEIPEGIDINRLFIQVVEGQPKALLTLDTLPNAGQYLTTHTLDTALQLLQPNFSGYIHQWLQLFQSQYTLTNFQLWQPIWTYLQQHTNVEVAQLTQYYLETITAYTEQTSTQIQQELLQYTRQTEDQYFTIQILLENIQPINNPKNKTQKQITDNQSPTTNHQSLITNHQSRTTKKQSLYLQNAGLVLLWPMFTHFFKTLELTADKQFKDAAAQHRAIHLTQYLVTAQPQTPEYQLPLNKILCGIDLIEPIPLGINLTEAETKLAHELLEVVLSRWTKLSKSTIANLRGSFLLRNGKLSQKGDHFHLLVERVPYDLLLRYLPWSYSTIRLPWMNTVLFVDWDT